MMLMLVAGLLVLSSGCRVLPQVFPGYRGSDSFADCVRGAVRAPADWCWGNCPVADDDLQDVRIDGVQKFDRK
jgi:hypothetical protein